MMRRRHALGFALLIGPAAVVVTTAGGCAGGDGPTSRPTSDADRRQADILAHPTDYGATGNGGRPIFGNDDRDTIGHDFNSILNP